MLLRAKPLRRRDLAGRRQFLRAGALAAGSYLVWELQRPQSARLGLRGRALCGKDVTGHPWNPPWPMCVVCVDLYEQGLGR